MVAGWLGSALGPAAAQAPTVAAHERLLPLARSLPGEVQAALQGGNPLTVMISLEGCAYCRVVREHFLVPLVQQGLPVVQIDWRSQQTLEDFTAQTTHDEAVRRWKIRVAPTLLFLGRGGRELAPRLVGVSSVDFYGAYLEARLQESRKVLHS
jgi:hypothetical protein